MPISNRRRCRSAATADVDDGAGHIACLGTQQEEGDRRALVRTAGSPHRDQRTEPFEAARCMDPGLDQAGPDGDDE